MRSAVKESMTMRGSYRPKRRGSRLAAIDDATQRLSRPVMPPGSRQAPLFHDSPIERAGPCHTEAPLGFFGDVSAS